VKVPKMPGIKVAAVFPGVFTAVAAPIVGLFPTGTAETEPTLLVPLPA
jgi:hypothetical protein